MYVCMLFVSLKVNKFGIYVLLKFLVEMCHIYFSVLGDGETG